MRESIMIQYNSFADPASVDAFVDSLKELLSEEGSQAIVTSKKVRPFQLDGQQFRVVWKGAYQFTSPDGHYQFGESDIEVKVETTDLDFSTYTQLITSRGQALASAQRRAWSQVLEMSIRLSQGEHRPANVNTTDYIRDTLQAAVDAFPKDH